MAKNYDDLEGLHPGLNGFDLSSDHFTTAYPGTLIPIDFRECIPGDKFDIDIETMIRCQPMLAPILGTFIFRVDFFFVPTRLVWKKWIDFITTIEQDKIPPTQFDGSPPVWAESDDGQIDDIDTSSMSLWDYFKLPRQFKKNASKEARPVDYLRRGYYLIYNEWYRDQNIQEPIDFHNDRTQKVLHRSWRKDYFTSGFTSRQKGDPVSIPLTSTQGVNFNLSENSSNFDFGPVPNYTVSVAGSFPSGLSGNSASALENVLSGFDRTMSAYNTIDWSQVTTFDVSDMRDMFAIQRFMEHNMMFGTRYIEYLKSWFGVAPSDKTLQRPDLIGTIEFPIKVSEVIQNSESNLTPQGNQTGHGLGVGKGQIANYMTEEYGYIIAIANIQPPAVYHQGIPRCLFRKTIFDQVNPAFYNLSYQAVHRREIFATGDLEEDEIIFNYQGRFDECREEHSKISGDLRDKLSFYLNFRNFEEAPVYNGEFIECKPSLDVFAVQDEPPFIIWFYSDIKAMRPLPPVSTPGRIDHIYGE